MRIAQPPICMQGTARTFFCCLVALATLSWLLAFDFAMLFSQSQFCVAALVPITVCAGFSFGACWTLMSVTTSELFGLKHFSSNYAAVQLAPIMATTICPTLLVGRLYDRAARAQHPHSHHADLPCTGRTCFASSFGILTALSVVVRAADSALTLLTSACCWLLSRNFHAQAIA